MEHWSLFLFFFFNETATTEIYTLSLHDALPICAAACDAADREGVALDRAVAHQGAERPGHCGAARAAGDRKSTRLNSSHVEISYAVFCLKKKKKKPLHPSDELTKHTDLIGDHQD